ncbi:FecR family protein [Lentiprolixibacter aurantiacus]|uniref:FecR family protein n=1 Tax=Lentiprolixibacter aurantiacus TaxID=2993939 RepID=A0AAE3SPJ1_9FLAO|nr:FecR family protein [Lentiprolixibacter aurantiacus]MCX2720645.1 FecR family protein [Lentiprolixibacter aurantiacus]
MQENYLAKWLNNELSEEERKLFEQSEEFASYQRLIEASGKLSAPEFDVEKALADLQQRKENAGGRVVPLNSFRKFIRVAAAVAAIAVLSVYFLSSGDITVHTEFAERSEVVLPDNSEIILNAGSEITYSEKNWDKERTLNLKGEAFFKVAKGEKFQVATEAGIVTVLGTQFNVENRNGYFEVSCFEGLVSVNYQGEETQLAAGDAFLAIRGEIIPADSPTEVVPAWMLDESSFKSTPLVYVLGELERQFDLEVTTQNVDLDQLYTGSFSNTNLNLALESISAPSNLAYTIEGKQVLIYAKD